MFKYLLRSAILATGLLFGIAHASVIDSTGGIPSGQTRIGNFGSGGQTATYGQTFHVGSTDTVLNSFTMYLNGTAALNLRGYIGAWNGTTVTSLLYSSATLAAPIGTDSPLNFNTGNLQLDADADYVAFLSISELAAQPAAFDNMPWVGDTIAGGFVFFNNSSFGQLTGSAWGTGLSAGHDAWFKATLSADVQNEVPEPGSLALIGLGLAGLAAIRKRKQA